MKAEVPQYDAYGFDTCNDRPDYNTYNYVVRLTPEDGKAFRFVREDGRPATAWIGKLLWIGNNGESQIPPSVEMHLPYWPDNTLLDRILPPHPELLNIRASGGYLMHLLTEDGGSVTTSGGYFEEFALPSHQSTA